MDAIELFMQSDINKLIISISVIVLLVVLIKLFIGFEKKPKQRKDKWDLKW